MNERDVLKSCSKLWFMSLCLNTDLHCNHKNSSPVHCTAAFLSTFLLDDTSHEHVWNSYQKTHLSHISLLHPGLFCIFFWCSSLTKKIKKPCWWQHTRWEGYLICFNTAIACSAILLIETISNNCIQLLVWLQLKFATKKLQLCYWSIRSFPTVVQKSFLL